MVCNKHGVRFVYKSVPKKDGSTGYIWSCPEKDAGSYCREGTWSNSKTPAEEMVNILATIRDDIRLMKNDIEDIKASSRPVANFNAGPAQAARTFPTPTPSSAANNSYKRPPNDDEIRVEDIPFN